MTDYRTTGQATINVKASPSEVFAVLTDLEQLPKLSPENQRCEFLEGSTTIEVGATFRGHNEARGYEWHADCVVTTFEADKAFEYQVPIDFEHATTWSYHIEPTPDGCRVTESFDAPMLGMPDIYPGKIEGRCENLEQACEKTLAELKLVVESN